LIKKYPNINYVGFQISNNDPSKAAAEVGSTLAAHPNLAGIFATNEPATFPVNGVIKAWSEALPLMKTGAKWQLFVPAELAYGEKGAGCVPTGRSLVLLPVCKGTRPVHQPVALKAPATRFAGGFLHRHSRRTAYEDNTDPSQKPIIYL
jgi:hypothetical protein